MISLRDILRPGITGTIQWPGGSVTANSDAVVRQWLSACYACARTLRGKPGKHTPCSVGLNYHTFDIEIPGTNGVVQLLLHAVLPYVGARRPGQVEAETMFVDAPWDPALLPASFVVLPADLLQARFILEPWMRELADPSLLYDVRHHHPQRVGDLVFNRFD